jgi:hypothetical protein
MSLDVVLSDVIFVSAVPGNIHSGVSGNDSIMATGVYSARELLRVTRRKKHRLTIISLGVKSCKRVLCSILNRKQKTALELEKMSLIASVRLPIEYRMS